jgi:hypothetical protein
MTATYIPLRQIALFQIAVTVFVALCLGFSPLIDASAHAGGFVFGFLIGSYYFGTLIRVPVPAPVHPLNLSAGRESTFESLRQFVPILALGCVLFLFVLGFIIFYTAITPSREWCPVAPSNATSIS